MSILSFVVGFCCCCCKNPYLDNVYSGIRFDVTVTIHSTQLPKISWINELSCFIENVTHCIKYFKAMPKSKWQIHLYRRCYFSASINRTRCVCEPIVSAVEVRKRKSDGKMISQIEQSICLTKMSRRLNGTREPFNTCFWSHALESIGWNQSSCIYFATHGITHKINN